MELKWKYFLSGPKAFNRFTGCYRSIKLIICMNRYKNHERTAMPIVDAVQADPGFWHRPLVYASNPGGPGADAARGWMPITWYSLGKSALGCGVCFFSWLMFWYGRRVRANVSAFFGSPLAVVARGWWLINGRGDAAVVRGATIRTRPTVSLVQIAAFLRSAPVCLRVLEAPREVDHEAGGSGTLRSAIRISLCAIFSERRGKWFFLYATCSRPHLLCATRLI